MKQLKIIFALGLILGIFGSISDLNAQEQQVRTRFEGLDQLLNDQSFFGNHHSGFMLFDLDSQQVLYERNSHLYFIPASTTKWLTLYATMLVLPKELPAFRYVENGKSITIWGTGYPGWKYRDIPQVGITAFLQQYDQINFSPSNWKDDAFGYGWQWDDYYYSYSSEKSPFPIYGNFVTFLNQKRTPVTNIPLFGKVQVNTDLQSKEVVRDFFQNRFSFNPNSFTVPKSEVPFITSPSLFMDLMKQEVGKPVFLVADSVPEKTEIFQGAPIRYFWNELMQESDNFIAEQLMLMVSEQLFGMMNTERAITYIQKTYLWDLPDKPQWVDASGLSRHNLMTPRSMIALLAKMEQITTRKELMNILPVGGISGTLKNNYKAKSPYLYAKTGSMSNNSSLVGYIKTDSGRILAFAFLNNNFMNKNAEIRREREKVMVFIKENY